MWSWKKIGGILLASCCFPYVVTLGWTGDINGKGKVLEPADPKLVSGRQVILDRDRVSSMDVEQYLVGAVAQQIPAEYELEAIKAQAVIARTYIYGQMGDRREIAESELDMDYLEQEQMEELWGTKGYMELYEKIEEAVAQTNSQVMEYEGELIDAWFCRLSAGKTRPGDEAHPYLASVDCPEDLEADGFLQIREWLPDEFSRLISQIPDGGPVSADQVPGKIQIGERDEAGYVSLVQIGNYPFTGDAVRYGLGLASPFFRFEDHEGNVRAVVKGIGHGYGLSQYSADKKAGEGWTYEQILKHFYQNIVLISE